MMIIHHLLVFWGLFLEGPINFRAGKLLCVCRVYIQDQSFNNFENSEMKLSVSEAKLTGLCARNCTSIQQVCLRARFRAFTETGSWAVKQMVRRTGSEFSEKGKNPKLFRLLTFLFPRIVRCRCFTLFIAFILRSSIRKTLFSWPTFPVLDFSRVVALPFAITAGEIN